MIIVFTRRCLEQCTHCMQDTSPDSDEHMTFATARNVARFLNEFQPKAVLFTGGEITCHPRFYEVAMKILEELAYTPAVVIQSNGHFVHNKNHVARMKDLLEWRQARTASRIVRQISVVSDERYYPNYHDFCHATAPLLRATFGDKVMVETNCVGRVMPVGRGANISNPEQYGYGPSCLNMSLVCLQVSDLKAAIANLEARGVLCKPAILPNGDVVPGETYQCRRVGNVNDEHLRDIYLRVNSEPPCNKCGLFTDKYEATYSFVRSSCRK